MYCYETILNCFQSKRNRFVYGLPKNHIKRPQPEYTNKTLIMSILSMTKNKKSFELLS